MIKQAIREGYDMALKDGLLLERKLFLKAIRTEDSLSLTRLYVATGQNREKMAHLLEMTSDPPSDH